MQVGDAWALVLHPQAHGHQAPMRPIYPVTSTGADAQALLPGRAFVPALCCHQQLSDQACSKVSALFASWVLLFCLGKLCSEVHALFGGW